MIKINSLIFIFAFASMSVFAAPDDGSTVHTGQATYYAATGGGNCSFDAVADASEILVGAMNELDYDNSTVCGSFVHITGPEGEVTAMIVDRCPECPEGNIDLSPAAFETIAPLAMGLIDISWTFVPGDVTGPISYKFNIGSNEWWTSIQIRNHRTAVASVEIKDQDGDWAMLDRQMDNFFSNNNGYGQGPYTIRVTDIYGQQLIDDGIAFSVGGVEEGEGNFPSPLAVKRVVLPGAGKIKTESSLSFAAVFSNSRNLAGSARAYNLRGRAVNSSVMRKPASGLYILVLHARHAF
jgi:expansin (peptidoglycan-binding protein)